MALHKKWSFLLRISSVNVTKSTVSFGFGHIYRRNPQWKKLHFLCSVVIYCRLVGYVSSLWFCLNFKKNFRFWFWDKNFFKYFPNFYCNFWDKWNHISPITHWALYLLFLTTYRGYEYVGFQNSRLLEFEKIVRQTKAFILILLKTYY